MTYFTADELRRAGGLTASAAASELSHMDKSTDGSYDIFLSHSVHDAAVVWGLKRELENEGVSVYVDWDDPDLDRSRITALTAQRLRQRMRSCRALVYATSPNASTSRWMPWELGYFDGHQSRSKVAVCPVREGPGAYAGEEYLHIYKRIERMRSGGSDRPFVLRTSGDEAESIASFVNAKPHSRRSSRALELWTRVALHLPEYTYS